MQFGRGQFEIKSFMDLIQLLRPVGCAWNPVRLCYPAKIRPFTADGSTPLSTTSSKKWWISLLFATVPRPGSTRTAEDVVSSPNFDNKLEGQRFRRRFSRQIRLITYPGARSS